MHKGQLPKQRPEGPPLDVAVLEQGDGVCLMECDGTIDIRTAPRFGAALQSALRIHRLLIVDLCHVTRIDSTGIGQIAQACKHLLPGARMQIRATDPGMRTLLDIAGLGQLVAVRPDAAA